MASFGMRACVLMVVCDHVVRVCLGRAVTGYLDACVLVCIMWLCEEPMRVRGCTVLFFLHVR